MCEDVNAKGLYYKNMIKIEQDHNKDTYQKLVLNRLNVMCNSTSIYTHWAPNSNKLKKKKFNLHVVHVQPCVAHVYPCGN